MSLMKCSENMFVSPLQDHEILQNRRFWPDHIFLQIVTWQINGFVSSDWKYVGNDCLHSWDPRKRNLSGSVFKGHSRRLKSGTVLADVAARDIDVGGSGGRLARVRPARGSSDRAVCDDRFMGRQSSRHTRTFHSRWAAWITDLRSPRPPRRRWRWRQAPRPPEKEGKVVLWVSGACGTPRARTFPTVKAANRPADPLVGQR